MAGGGRVRGVPGAQYYLTAGATAITNVTVVSSAGANASLVIGSNTTLDMTDCFVTMVNGTGAAPIVNYSMVSGTVGTASTASGSANVTTALAASASATTTGSGSNAGVLNNIGAWSSPSAGVLSCLSTAGFPSAGTLTVFGSSGSIATITYTGITGTTFTGCQYVSGAAGGQTAVTGNNIIIRQSIVVYNTSTVFAGGGGISPLVGLTSGTNTSNTFLSVVNLDTTALTAGGTTTAAPAILYTRDSNITIRGGYWNFGTNTDAANDIYTSKFLLRHLDHYVIDVQGVATTAKGFCAFVADVTDGWVRMRNLNTVTSNGDGLHVNGPCYGLVVDELSGLTGDDTLGITASGYPVKNDCSGNVVGVRVNVIDSIAGVRSLSVIAGVGNNIDNVVCTSIRGAANNSIGCVTVGDDTAQATTTGGTYGYIDLGVVASRPGSSNQLVNLQAPAAKKIRMELDFNWPSTYTYGLLYGCIVSGSSTATIELLEISGAVNAANTSAATNLLYHSATSVTVGKAVIDKVNFTGNGTGCNLVQLSGSVTVNDLTLIGCRYTASNGNVVYVNGTGAVLSQLTALGCTFGNSALMNSTSTTITKVTNPSAPIPAAGASKYGNLGWTFDPINGVLGATAITSQTMYFTRFTAESTGPCGHLGYWIGTIASGLTAGQNFVAIYDTGQASAGNATLLAASATTVVDTPWTSTSLKQTALSSNAQLIAGQDYFAVFAFTGTTGPLIAHAANDDPALINMGLTGLGLRSGSYAATFTTALPSTVTAASIVLDASRGFSYGFVAYT